MCVVCVRKSKRVGISKGKFGKIKFWAHRFTLPWLLGAIPVFNDYRLNVGIEAHFHRINQARTFRRKEGRNGGNR